MMLLSLLVFILTLVLTNTDSAPRQEEQCGGERSTEEFDDILLGAAYFSRCTYPTHKLNADCILSSCPLLCDLCPMNPDKSVNTDALTSALSILNECIGQDCPICGINVSHTPMVQLGWTPKNLLPVDVVNGSGNLNPGTGFLNNLSLTSFTLVPTDNPKGPISLSILAPYINKKANYTCSFSILPSSFLSPLVKRLLAPSLTSLHMPNMTGNYFLNLSSVVSVDPTTPTPAINILQDLSNLTVAYSNFVTSDNETLPQTLVAAFNQGMDCFLKSSIITSSAINFLATYVALGLQAAQKNCQ